MKHIHIPTLVILGISIFCESVTSFDMANAIQIYWTALSAIIVLTCIVICVCLGRYKSEMFPKKKILTTICIIGILEILYALLQLAGLVPNNYRYAYFSGSLNNPAIFGMLLSFCITTSVYFSIHSIGKIRSFWYVSSLLFGLFIILSNSRTSLLSSITGIVIILLIEKEPLLSLIYCKRHKFLVITSIIITLGILYFYKQDSADGRILIWAICIEMIKDKPWLGWGLDGYIAQYMNYQADYLTSHPSSPFIQLAGETQNPFNEFLHIAILFGVPCALIFGVIVILLIWYIISRAKTYKSILLSFVCILVVQCMFCYPFNIPFIWLFILFIGICLFPKKIHLYYPKAFLGSTIIICLLCLFFLSTSAIHDFRRLYIQECSLKWDFNKIKEKYENIYNDYNKDYLFLYNYGALLHLYGDYQRSLEVFQQGKKYLSDYNMMLLMADDYQQIGLLDSAVTCYNRAHQMIPNRYLPMYYQMKLYEDYCKTDNAKAIAKEILRKDNKFKKSKKVQLIINEAKQCLN